MREGEKPRLLCQPSLIEATLARLARIDFRSDSTGHVALKTSAVAMDPESEIRLATAENRRAKPRLSSVSSSRIY